FYDGETKQLIKHHAYENKQKEEDKFAAWAYNKPEYRNVISDYLKIYEKWTPFAKARVYTIEGILGSPLTSFASSLMSVERALLETGSTEESIQRAVQAADKAR